MELVVVVDEQYGIGLNGNLLCHIPSDLKRFKSLTTGHVVIMGRKTLESFPGKKPLPNREHIILSRNDDFTIDNTMVSICHSLQDLTSVAKRITDKKLFIIGGGTVYEQLLPYCSKAHVTKIKECFKADTFFPNLDEMPNWQVLESSDNITENDIEYNFVTYINTDAKELNF